MRFNSLVPGARGVRLTAAILAALERVYRENVDRFDAEGIGDDATTFGITISRNLWHVVEGAVRDVVGVECRRAHNTFFLVVDETFEIYFCKAPPGASSVHALEFDESQVRGQIIKRNGSHLQLRLDLEGETTLPQADATPSPYAVVAHFGDFEDGFSHAVVGCPYRLPAGDTGWEWEHELVHAATPNAASEHGSGVASDIEVESFGLRLRTADHDAAIDKA